MAVRTTPSAAIVFALWLATDMLLIALFIAQGFGFIENEALQITRDRSYGEIAQYVKQFWAVLLLVGLAWWARWRFCAVATMLFTYFLVDDYTELHETMGATIALRTMEPYIFSIEAHHFGELIVFASYGIVALALVVAAFPREHGPQRRLARDLVGLLALMAFFGVLIDALHALPWPELIGDGIGLLEDGGEMIVMSVIVWRLLDEALRHLTWRSMPNDNTTYVANSEKPSPV